MYSCTWDITIVSMMTSEDSCSQIMYQKSIRVEDRGPCVAMYLQYITCILMFKY